MYAVQSKARNEKIHKYPRREFNTADCHKIRHDNLDKVSVKKTSVELHRSVEVLISRKELMKSRNEL